MKILNSIFHFVRDVSKAKTLRNDQEKRDKVKRFGVMSIIASILMVGFVFLFAWALKIMQNDSKAAILIWVLVLLFVACAIVLLINAIYYWILQIFVNRKPITWISLVVLLVSVGVSIYLFFAYVGA